MAKKAAKKKTAAKKPAARTTAAAKRTAPRGEPAPVDPIAEALRRRRAALLAH